MEPVHSVPFCDGLCDVRMAAASRSGPAKTFHDFTGNPDQCIDWVLSRGFKAGAARMITPHEGTCYPPDHLPIVTEFGR